jgi:hypothetical protein
VTRFALVDTRRLRLERTITLRGDFSFDAVSPRGRTMFLVNYTSPFDPTRYSVRAYDLLGKTLLPNPVRDPAERSDAMRGAPITRLMSTDGRWAYTLYDGNGKEPFLHALDTVRGSAVCVDLPQLSDRRNLFLLKLGLAGDGRRLVVRSDPAVQGRPQSPPLLIVDTRTFAVHRPAPVAEASSASSVPWLPISAGAAALAAALIWLLVRRERMADRRPLEQG